MHRALAWARHLPSFGWDVTILAAGPGGYWVHDPSLLAHVPPETEVLRVDAPTAIALLTRSPLGDARRGGSPGGGFGGALRAIARFFLLPDSYRAWAGPAIRAGTERMARGDIDVVLSTSPPETVHRVGETLARTHGRPWVADFRDPWVALHYRRPPTPLHAAAHRALERRALEGADRVLCASRTHVRAVEEQLGERARGRVVFLPNGIETETAGPPDAGPAASESPGAPPAGTPVARARIVATGTLVEVPALIAFLRALARRAGHEATLADTVEVVLAGPHDGSLPGLVSALQLGRIVKVPGPLPHAEARALQRSAAALLFVRNEGPGYAAMVPGKLYEYLDARRPLVAMVAESEAAEIARQAGAIVVDPTSADAALDAVLAAARRGAGSPGAPVPDLPAIDRILESRTRRALAGELAGVLDSLTPR